MLATLIRSSAAEWRQHISDMRERCAAPVSVAVLDSGIDGTHDDLRGRIKQAFSVDFEDGKTTIHEVDPTADNDRFGHGTSVASLIAKICPVAEIIDVRVLQVKNSGVIEALIAAVELAIKQRWTILNLSLAAQQSARPRLIDLCERAYIQNQIVVAARRNLPFGDDGFPAELSSCIGVDRSQTEFLERVCLNPGQRIEFGAMGQQVVAAMKGGGYTTVTGSSFSTPIISGVCALLRSAYGELRPYEVKSALKFASSLP